MGVLSWCWPLCSCPSVIGWHFERTKASSLRRKSFVNLAHPIKMDLFSNSQLLRHSYPYFSFLILFAISLANPSGYGQPKAKTELTSLQIRQAIVLKLERMTMKEVPEKQANDFSFKNVDLVFQNQKNPDDRKQYSMFITNISKSDLDKDGIVDYIVSYHFAPSDGANGLQMGWALVMGNAGNKPATSVRHFGGRWNANEFVKSVKNGIISVEYIEPIDGDQVFGTTFVTKRQFILKKGQLVLHKAGKRERKKV